MDSPTVNWEVIRQEALEPFTLAALPPTLQLPALPHAVMQFIEAAQNESASIKHLAEIVETDSGLTLMVLRHVNSSYVGLRSKAKTVQQALALLGLRQSKLFVISTGMQAAVQARRSKLINQTCFWNFSLQKALFAKEVARLLHADVDAAFAGSLLQDFLLPMLTTELYEQYAQFTEHRAEQQECLCEFEEATFGWTHALTGAGLAHRWKLPDDLVCCILFHHAGLRILSDALLARTSVAAVAISSLLPDQLRQHFTGLEQLMMLERKWPQFKLKELVERVDVEHAKLGMGVQNDFPLARRCRMAFGAGKNLACPGPNLDVATNELESLQLALV